MINAFAKHMMKPWAHEVSW